MVKAHEAKPIGECERFPEKKRFDLESEAKAVVDKVTTAPLDYYYCDSCHGYHLTKGRR